MKLKPVIILTILLGAAIAAAFYIMKQPGHEWNTQAGGKIQDPELSKIKTIFNTYAAKNIEVVVDGRVYPASALTKRANQFIRKNYKKGMSARAWIREHCGATDSGNVIYFIYPGGKKPMMKDVFLEELTRMEADGIERQLLRREEAIDKRK